VLFTAAGVDDVAAIYPNLSVYYYWNPRGKVVARTVIEMRTLNRRKGTAEDTLAV